MADLITRIQQVLDSHLGGDNSDTALLVTARLVQTNAGFRVSSAGPNKSEHAKLDQLARACLEVQRIYGELHNESSFSIFTSLGQQFEMISGKTLTLSRLADEVLPSIEKAKSAVADHGPAGSINWRAVGLADDCRMLWADQRGTAPRAVNSETAFGRFAEAMFKAAKLTSEDDKALPNSCRAAFLALKNLEKQGRADFESK